MHLTYGSQAINRRAAKPLRMEVTCYHGLTQYCSCTKPIISQHGAGLHEQTMFKCPRALQNIQQQQQCAVKTTLDKVCREECTLLRWTARRMALGRPTARGPTSLARRRASFSKFLAMYSAAGCNCSSLNSLAMGSALSATCIPNK